MKTHVTAKGQITIPAELRKKYGIKNGTRIVVIDNDDSIILIEANDRTISQEITRFFER